MIRSGGVGVAPDPVHGTPALTRCAWPEERGATSGSGLSNGVSTWGVAQRKHRVVLARCGGLQFVFPWAGAYEEAAGAPYAGIPANAGTIALTLWVQDANPNLGGAPIDLFFAGGPSTPIEPAEVVVSDPIAALVLVRDQVVWTRTLVKVPPGGTWPNGVRTVPQAAGEDGGREGTGEPPVDYLHGGTIPAVYPDLRYSPASTAAVEL